jgi:hypothetical protein
MNASVRLRTISKERVKTAIDAAREADIDVAGFEVSPDGTIRVLGKAAFPVAPKDDFEKWDQSGLLD